MKYAAFFICLLVLSFNTYARTITSFKQSDAIQSISNMLSENDEDLQTAFKISDKKYAIRDMSKCGPVDPSVAWHAFKDAIDSLTKLFPDEEIPVQEALNDMKDYLDNTPLTLCKFFYNNSEKQTVMLYFFDKSDKIHLRVDRVTEL
jgi:hypothetical protein